MDPRFRVNVISCTPNPQQTIYAALHQDYSEGYVFDQIGTDKWPDEKRAGEIALKRILGGELHAGPLEHAQIVFNVGWFPHSVMQQARTHRVGCCLSGDTVVEFGHSSTLGSKGATHYKISVKRLADLWHNGCANQKTEASISYMQSQIMARNLLHLNEDTGVVEHTNITNIYCNGPKEVFLITLEDGKSIKATKDHQVFTPNGWTTFGQLSAGDEVMTAATCTSPLEPPKDEKGVNQTEEWKTCNGFPFYEVSTHGNVRSWAPRKHRGKLVHPSKPRAKKPSKGASGSYLFVSLSDGEGKHVRKNVHTLVLETFVGPAPKNYVARHLNGNHLDNKVSNLKWGTQVENANDRVLHGVTTRKRGVAKKIVSIEAAGIEETYDLEVVGPFHNFIANGIVVHNSFDVQSGRYTGDRIIKCAEGIYDVEDVFYLRPVGHYTDRKGHKYYYDEDWRAHDLAYCLENAKEYALAISKGAAEEHARGKLAFDFRQNFVFSANMRSLGHLLTIRGKRDAQLEIQQMCQLMLPHYEAWAPEIYSWFAAKQWQKGRLAL